VITSAHSDADPALVYSIIATAATGIRYHGTV